MENTDNYVQDEAVVNNMFFAQQVGSGDAGTGSGGSDIRCESNEITDPSFHGLKVKSVRKS